MRKKYLLTAVLLAAVAVGEAFAVDTNPVTEVISFKPAAPAGKPQAGYCWSESIAVSRKDAWRCSVDHSIYDPCFSTGSPAKVVCDADPAKKSAGFVLKLTKPLPTRQTDIPSATDANVWTLELGDGSICTIYTGTLPIIPDNNGIKAVRYGCDDSTKDLGSGVLDESIKTGKVWQAQKITYSSSSTETKIIKIQDVTIKRVWR